jgi:hypothetical protein
LKNYIYREPVNNLEELNDRIYEALATVIPNMLRLAWENLIKRTRLCFHMEGGHLGHLLCYNLLFCWTLSEFENFLLCERILINVTTYQKERQANFKDLEPLRGSSNKKKT